MLQRCLSGLTVHTTSAYGHRQCHDRYVKMLAQHMYGYLEWYHSHPHGVLDVWTHGLASLSHVVLVLMFGIQGEK
jgi:hypothetical protein